MTQSLEEAPLTQSVELSDESRTILLGRAIARALTGRLAGLNIHLSGELGSGKTTLVRALLRALGVTGRIKSPTFALVEPYVISVPDTGSGLDIRQYLSIYCYHFDFYRFTDPREWDEAGFRELFNDKSLCLVEWPERAVGGSFPQPDLRIRMDVSGAGRVAQIEAFTPAGKKCLSAVDFSLPA